MFIFVVKQCKWSAEFYLCRKYRKAHQRHLSTTTMLLTASPCSKYSGPMKWVPGKKKRIPLGLVDDIVEHLKQAAVKDEQLVQMPPPTTPMKSGSLLTIKSQTTLAAADQTRPTWGAQLSPNGAATLLQSGAELSKEHAATILSVDDDEGQQLIIKTLFGQMGYVVETAMSGEDALAKLEQGLPDVLLLDFSFPPAETLSG
jgi:hypothetical protein